MRMNAGGEIEEVQGQPPKHNDRTRRREKSRDEITNAGEERTRSLI